MRTTKTIIAFLFAATAFTLSAQEAKYEIKSAIIKKETVAMGQTIESTCYFDDFGKKESAEITLKNGIAQGVDKHIRTLMDSASIVNIDLDLKVGNRMALPDKPINYLQLTPEIKDKYKIKDTGEEDIIGKSCRKYSLEMTQMGQTLQIKTWIWKGIVLKSETSGNGMVFATETATEILENISVPEEKFKAPEGAIIQ